MAFGQFTRCVQPANWKPRSYWIITLQSLTLAPFATVLALGMAKPWCLLIVGEIVGLSWVIAYARHFLYHRLICLGGDRDVIGAIVTTLFLGGWQRHTALPHRAHRRRGARRRSAPPRSRDVDALEFPRRQGARGGVQRAWRAMRATVVAEG